ncbi:hypothetical protein [Cryptosporangium arvum]|uniref:hypothetical protein n=1 Tax=Cryptosporangium arvum TaxID=80871 RepID=UPI0004B88563|nr:hypothetical protein [Cryptosporangium arvum]
MTTSTSKRHVVAAVLTVAGGLALIVLGWWFVGFEYQGDWGRFADGSWWASEAVKAVGLLAFGKVGFKVALVCVGAAIAIGAKVVSRRRRELS